ncbi:DUF262 domain-containing protein [Thermodesulfobacteriota bacterium]
MEITPKDLTIGQLFANYNEQFLIPAYQRRYAWKYNQYAALFDDIDNLGTNEKHLFGTVLFNSGFFKGGLNTPEIVDGQQRITTLSLLFLAIKSRYLELKNKKKAEEVDKYLISKDYDEKIQNKLILGDLDNPDYAKILKAVEIDKILNQNLKDAYEYFLEFLRDYFPLKELNLFFFKLSNNCVVIRLDISDAKNVYKLFEIINNRGLRLSATDIIKNFILGHASQLGERSLSDIKRLWADIIVSLDNINTDNFLRQYLASILRRKVTAGSLISEFKDHYKKNVKKSEMISEFSIEDEYSEDDDENENNSDKQNTKKIKKINITTFLRNIKRASIIYSNLLNKAFPDNNINRALNDLDRIQSFPTNIFMLELFSRELNKQQYYKALNQLKSFMIRRNICEYRTGELDAIFARLCKVSDTNLNQNIKKELIEDFPRDEEFINYFQKHQFKGKNKERAKYVLEQIEYYLTDNKNEYVINTSDEVHLEHIMPQNISTNKSKNLFGNWEQYLGSDHKSKHKRYVWRIGNLTLLSDELNLGASNNPFTKKKIFYKKSSLQINAKIIANNRQFRFNNQEKRGYELAKIAVKIWQL